MNTTPVGRKRAKPFLIINSHPVQYFAPLYRQMAADSSIDMKVLYCSRHGLDGELDQQFGTSVQWDIPLLTGYSHEFISNQSPAPSIYTFWGLLNFSVIGHLWRAPKSVVIIHGWAYAVCWLTLVFARLFGHTVCLRGESPLRLEQTKSKASRRVRRLILGHGLFKLVHYFAYIGQQNYQFYRYMGVQDSQLLFCPYSVDNDRFQQQAAILCPQRTSLRQRLQLPENAFVVLSSGKYTAKKRPLDILKAIAELKQPNLAAVLVGDGSLRPELNDFIARNDLRHISLTGFINQSAISEYYAAADAYVMCSTEEETWGLSTNEAMNFGLPIVLYDTVGCTDDLLADGENGFKVAFANTAGLAAAFQTLASMSLGQRRQMGRASLDRVSGYSYANVIESLKAIA
ncbi:glycosyltransferase [Fibrella aquatica]|uniref:glycosyltransferase n=1 Tax=Fibrella aquatica TaxID=3242487 RepID=UPI003522F505